MPHNVLRYFVMCTYINVDLTALRLDDVDKKKIRERRDMPEKRLFQRTDLCLCWYEKSYTLSAWSASPFDTQPYLVS